MFSIDLYNEIDNSTAFTFEFEHGKFTVAEFRASVEQYTNMGIAALQASGMEVFRHDAVTSQTNICHDIVRRDIVLDDTDITYDRNSTNLVISGLKRLLECGVTMLDITYTAHRIGERRGDSFDFKASIPVSEWANQNSITITLENYARNDRHCLIPKSDSKWGYWFYKAL